MTRTAVAVAVVALAAGPAAGQELRWRADYAAARKDAAAAGRPLLLDFSAEWCGPCKRMDATTFRDPAVAAAVTARTIPVRVDADRDAWLVKAAGVQAFPTLLLLSADGKVIARHEGFADAAAVTAFLRQAPEPRPAAVQQAVAVQPLSAPPAVQQTAATVPSPAADLLAAARADFAAGRYLACIERCDRITAGFRTAPEADAARQLAAAVTADPQKWRRVIEQLEANLAAARRDLPPAR
jgi:thioredoxin-like negative regulator of GroEL